MTQAIVPKLYLATGLPPHIMAGQTTRHHQTSAATAPIDLPYSDFNLALHVGDDPIAVQANRQALLTNLSQHGARRLVWLNQTHSTTVAILDEHYCFTPKHADALITRQVGLAGMIMTADCLPIVLCDITGQEVACIHAGWRGLLNGIIENTVRAMTLAPYFAWFGAAIGPTHFEVGFEVYDAYCQQNSHYQTAITQISSHQYLANLYQLARFRLEQLGVMQITGGEYDTFAQSDEFYSYRKHATTGRMATFVMIKPT